VETRPFDPAQYLDGEEAIAAYLADARAHGSQELAEATAVVQRAREMRRRGSLRGISAGSQPQGGVAEEAGPEFRGGSPAKK